MTKRTLKSPAPRLQTVTTVLAPTDFSAAALAGVRGALEVAARYDAELVLLHVVEPLNPVSYLRCDVERQAHSELRRHTERELAALARDLARIRVRWFVREGVPWLTITRFAKTVGADLIVMSTHGRSGLKRVLLGSVAERVVRHAPCPVLTIR
jgi:universal stress protein A